MELEILKPEEIEKRSFEIITEELGDKLLDERQAPVIKRVIHATADFDYADTLYFTKNALERGYDAIRRGACIVTDTKMAYSGINKAVLADFGGEVYNFISDADVAKEAKKRGVTRSAVSMEKAGRMGENRPFIFAIGNAPTALLKLYEMIENGSLHPELVIGVPVGFVNVVQSKELILETGVPAIVAKGRKGGSNVAAAICNALLYELRLKIKLEDSAFTRSINRR